MTTQDLLDKAVEDYRDANARCAHYTMLRLAELARAAFPQAKQLAFDWSDQGDFLNLVEVLDADGNDLDEDGDFDDETISWNLGSNNEHVWGKFMTGPDYVADIDDILAATVSA